MRGKKRRARGWSFRFYLSLEKLSVGDSERLRRSEEIEVRSINGSGESETSLRVEERVESEVFEL
jgi:hypothetical protein